MAIWNNKIQNGRSVVEEVHWAEIKAWRGSQRKTEIYKRFFLRLLDIKAAENLTVVIVVQRKSFKFLSATRFNPDEKFNKTFVLQEIRSSNWLFCKESTWNGTL